MQQLTLIVTCTDRKVKAPAQQLTAGSLPGLPTASRCALWIERLSTADADTYPLDQLYKGDSWVQQRVLMEELQRRVPTRALVASAGLGLQDLDSTHPSYAATFSPAHEDTVCPSDDSSAWWLGLQNGIGSVRIDELSGPILAVLSTPYARAMDADLRDLGTRDDTDVLLIGGWKDIPGVTRIPADRTLRKALGGTVGSLLPRMAQQWVRLWDGDALTSDSALAPWTQWREAASVREDFTRLPLEDEEVIEFIHRLRSQAPTVSATFALRALRDAGFACEQKRFGRLFAASRGVAA